MLHARSDVPIQSLLTFSVVTGISNAAMIAVINSAAETVSNEMINWKLTLLYVLVTAIFYYSKTLTLNWSSELVESVIYQIRARLADKARRSELNALQNVGKPNIYARITQDATMISNTSTTMINSAQSVIMIFFALLYIAFVSFWSFILLLGGLAIGYIYLQLHTDKFQQMWLKVSEKQTDFFSKLDHILTGFKEIKINSLKNEKVFETYLSVNNQLKNMRIQTSKHYNIALIFDQMLFYFILGVILFVLPKFHAEQTEVMIKVVAAVLFIAGPLEGIIFSIPNFANANQSARNILELEAELDADLAENKYETQNHPLNSGSHAAVSFQHNIVIQNLTHSYENRDLGAYSGFESGPFNLTINKGEIIFITGGNGSGKSTFVHLLTGLLEPLSGKIFVDQSEKTAGTPVNYQNISGYRNLFGAIFSNYHLFDKLYGVPEEKIDIGRVNLTLQEMGLPPEKIQYDEGKFSSLSLSSGQRKRVALATALLEDKDIYIFDEVAADLDPAFRDYYYYEFLPMLKTKGKTLLVISHDQQYWKQAGRILHFLDGKLTELDVDTVNKTII